MVDDFNKRRRPAEFEAVASAANPTQFFDSAQVNDRSGFSDAIFEPVERVHAPGKGHRVVAVFLQQVLRVGNRSRLQQLERWHHVTNYSHSSLRCYRSSRHYLYECGQRVLHWTTGFERSQNRVQVDGRTAINLIAKRIRQRIQNCAATASD